MSDCVLDASAMVLALGGKTDAMSGSASRTVRTPVGGGSRSRRATRPADESVELMAVGAHQRVVLLDDKTDTAAGGDQVLHEGREAAGASCRLG